MRRLATIACLLALSGCGTDPAPAPPGSDADAAGDSGDVATDAPGGVDVSIVISNPHGDEDGDGRTNAEELRGWEIFIDFSGFGLKDPAFLTRRTVTSDPYVADTDGDGLSDGEEFERNSDPRVRDTDGDGLGDAEEVRRWKTSPVSVDSDTDSRGDDPSIPQPPSGVMFDGAELNLVPDPLDPTGERLIPGPNATSPTSADTDGDGVGDGAERQHPVRSPVLAELPKVGFEIVDQIDLRLEVEFSSSTLGSKSYGHTFSASATAGIATSDTEASKHTSEKALKISGEATIGLPPGVKVTIETTTKDGVAATFGQSLSASSSESFSEAHSAAVSETTGASIATEGGLLTMGLRIHNAGKVAFAVSDLGIGVRMWDSRVRRFRTLGTLQPITGFDSFSLGVGEGTAVVPFTAEMDAELTRRFMANASSLVFEPAGYELTDASGTSFVFTAASALANTALVTLDFGGGETFTYRVATNIDRTATGDFAGVRLARVLEWLGHTVDIGVNSETGERVLTGIDGRGLVAFPSELPAPDLNDPPYPDGVDPGPRLFKKFWAMFASRVHGDVDLSRDFEAITLQARDAVTLAYVTDADRDGVFARQEGAQGGSDQIIHSDAGPGLPTGDGLSDFFEMSVGWLVDINGDDAPAPYQVYPNPRLVDSDADGWTDAEELALGTDPTSPDTDRDGLSDMEDDDPLVFVNTPPVVSLTPLTTYDSVTLEGTVTDAEDNVAQIRVFWGDQSEPTTVYADDAQIDLNSLSFSYTYGTSATFTITVEATDFYGAVGTQVIDLNVVAFPVDAVIYDTFNGDLSATLCATDPGLDDFDNSDRRGPGQGQSCQMLQQSNDTPDTLAWPDVSLEMDMTIAVWLRFDGTPSNAGFIVGQSGFPALVLDGNQVTLVVKTGFDPVADKVTLPAPEQPYGSWAFYVATMAFDTASFSTVVTLYKDGVQVGQQTIEDWLQFPFACGGFSMGGVFENPAFECSMAIGDRYRGAFDDLRVFSRALTPAEITTLYQEP